MKKNVFQVVLLAFIFLGSIPALAQFSAGAELGLPLGGFSTVSGPGFGLSARYEAPIQANFNWTASAGFLSFSGNTYLGGAYGTATVIPLVGGAKYYFGQANSGLYAAADVGLNIITYSTSYPNGQAISFRNSGTTRFSLSPGAGYRLGRWDFTGRLNLMTDFNYLGARAAYVFGIKGK